MVIDLSQPVKAYFTDDDLDDFELFHEAISQVSKNIETVPFSTCELLLKALKESTPHIIFIDINLGAMSGIDCLKVLQSMPHLSNVPKVIMSTSASKVQMDECVKLGCNYYLQKPSSYNAVMNEMRIIFERDWESITL